MKTLALAEAFRWGKSFKRYQHPIPKGRRTKETLWGKKKIKKKDEQDPYTFPLSAQKRGRQDYFRDPVDRNDSSRDGRRRERKNVGRRALEAEALAETKLKQRTLVGRGKRH